MRFDQSRQGFAARARSARPEGALWVKMAGALVMGAGLALGASNWARADEPLPERTELGYDVYFGGQLIATAQATVDWSDERYRIAGQVETVGFVNWMTSYRGETQSDGRWLAGTLAPESHRNWGSFRGRERTTTIAYAGGSATEVVVVPEPDASERTPLPPDAGVGTLDPLSAVIGMAFSMKDGAACEGVFPIFDGRRRYDVTVEPAEARVLDAIDYSIFTGEAATCRITDYKRLGGFRKEPSKYAETTRRREAYVARVAEGALPVPVRIEVHTDYGALIIHLTRYAGQGIDLTLERES